jgi:hypothetical protein
MSKIYLTLNKFEIDIFAFHQPVSSITLKRLSTIRDLSQHDNVYLNKEIANKKPWQLYVNKHENNITKIKKEAKKYGVDYVDLHYIFDDWKKDVRTNYVNDPNALYVSPTEWTTTGSSIVAESIIQIITKN